MLQQLQLHRQILFDLTTHYLDQLDGSFQRLNVLSRAFAILRRVFIATIALAWFMGNSRSTRSSPNRTGSFLSSLLELPLAQHELDLADLPECLARWERSRP